MTRFLQSSGVLLLALVAGWAPHSLVADHALDFAYAEHLPLSTRSVLLDITRSGPMLVAVGERGHVLRSVDGKTWEQAEVVPTRSTLTTIFGVGDRLWAGGHDAVIITSGDHGNTWTPQFFAPDRRQAVMDIYFSDMLNGVAIGSYGLYLTTRDGGQTWEDGLVDEDNDYHLNSLVHLGDGRQLIAGEAGYSYRSYDNGETWEAIDMPYLGSMWGAIKTREECVLFYGLRGHAMESCDFGTTWNELETGSEASISGAAIQDGLVLLAANNGTVLTRDDGSQFEAYIHSSGVDFAAVIPVGEGRFLLVGEDGVHHYPEAGGTERGDD